MPWAKFFVANLAGAVVWATLYGGGAYALGSKIHLLIGPLGIVALLFAVAGVVGTGLIIRRNEARLQAEAEAAYPGPLQKRSLFRRRPLTQQAL